MLHHKLWLRSRNYRK